MPLIRVCINFNHTDIFVRVCVNGKNNENFERKKASHDLGL